MLFTKRSAYRRTMIESHFFDLDYVSLVTLHIYTGFFDQIGRLNHSLYVVNVLNRYYTLYFHVMPFI